MTHTLVLFAAAAGGRGCVALLPLAPLVVLLGRAVVLVMLVVLFSGNSGGTNSSFGERVNSTWRNFNIWLSGWRSTGNLPRMYESEMKKLCFPS